MTETRTARLTIPARQLRRADRIANLTADRTVTAFDLEIGDDTVDVWPAQADLDAGAARRYALPAGEMLIVDREVEVDTDQVDEDDEAPTARVIVRGRPYTARRETADGTPGRIVVRNRWGGDVGVVFEPSGNTPRAFAAIVVGCPGAWSGEDSRRAAREILAQLDR